MKEIVCPNGCSLSCQAENGAIVVTGNRCPRGRDYAITELTNPMRTLTTSVRTAFPDNPVVSVRTDGAVPRSMLIPIVRALKDTTLESRVGAGAIVLENACGTGVNVICTTNRLLQSAPQTR